MVIAKSAGKLKCSQILSCLGMETDLLGKEKEEYVDVTAYGSNMQVGIVIWFLLRTADTPVVKSLDTFVGSILDGQGHEFASIALILLAFVDNVDLVLTVCKEHLNNVNVIIHNGIVYWIESMLNIGNNKGY